MCIAYSYTTRQNEAQAESVRHAMKNDKNRKRQNKFTVYVTDENRDFVQAQIQSGEKLSTIFQKALALLEASLAPR